MSLRDAQADAAESVSGAILGETTFAVIGLLFLLSAIRTFTSTLYMTLYGSVPNETVGAIALAVFATSILAIAVAWRSTPRRGIALAATLLAAGATLAAATRWNWGDILLSAVALVGGMWWLTLTQSARSGDGGSPFVVATPIALAADLAMRALFRTVPVVDVPGLIAPAIAVVGALVMIAAGFAAYGVERTWTSPGLRGSVALLALPPLLLIAETGATDPGQAAGIGSFARGLEAPGAWYAIAALLGIGMTAGAAAVARGKPQRRLVALAALVVGAGVMWSHLPYVATLGAALLAAGTIAAAATLPDTASRPAGSPLLATLAFAIGWIAFVGLAFVFYAYYTPAIAPLVAVAIVLVGLIAASPLPGPRLGLVGTGLVGVLAVLVPLVALAATPPAPLDLSTRTSFRLMTYNVHQGFDDGNVPSLDAIADTIRAETPDVVLLQEVGRGWMITEQHDVLTYLAERLGMQYVFGPEIGDAYGNAVLSKLPVTEVDYLHYERQSRLRYQPRGAIFFRVADILVIATHLDHNADATDVRQGQMHSILAKWNLRAPAIVAGDLNALPGSAELSLLQQSGFRDLAQADGADQATSPASNPHNRLDYVWGVGVSGTQAHTVASTASDHRPLVMTISRQK